MIINFLVEGCKRILNPFAMESTYTQTLLLTHLIKPVEYVDNVFSAQIIFLNDN